jgi:drug/metabolite transporter (DMT)-like permease
MGSIVIAPPWVGTRRVDAIDAWMAKKLLDALLTHCYTRPMRVPTTLAAYAALTTAAVVWGGSIVAQKLALDTFSAVEVSVLRGVGALAILFPLWWQKGSREKFSSRDILMLALLGLGVLGNHLLTLFGLRYIGAGAAGVIIGTSPTITALLSSLLLRDLPFRAVWVGCVVSFLGVALVSAAGPTEVSDRPGLGAVLVVVGLISWALYTIGGRTAMDRFSPLTVNWTTLTFSLLLQIPLLWMDPRVMRAGLASVPIEGWLALVYLIVFATALGQQAWLFGVKGIGPSRAGVFVNLIPVSALILSVSILGEAIGVKEMIGISLILLGVWLVNRPACHDHPADTT